MRVLLAGHWERLAADDAGESNFGESSATAVLKALGVGMRGAAEALGTERTLSFDLLPFGPGSAFAEGLVGRPGAEGRSAPLLLEHTEHHDWGLEELAALVRVERLSLDLPVETLEKHLGQARRKAVPQVVATTTPRSLLGPGGTAFLTPGLEPRTAPASPAQIEKWREALKRSWAAAKNRARGALPLAGVFVQEDPTLVEGSGAGGGLAALYLALGGRILPAWEVLAAETSLEARIAEADLVLFAQPTLDAPGLAGEPLGLVASIAQASGTPVVAVAANSSLSGPERADLGIHAVSTVRPGLAPFQNPFVDLGRRLGQTWIRE